MDVPIAPDALRATLDALVARYERPAFIADDPIALPHSFDDPRDREVVGLYAALLAWGKRSILLAKLAELVERMGGRPYQFVAGFEEERDGWRLQGFRHRTFQPEDALALTHALAAVLRRYGSVEALFAAHHAPDAGDIGGGIDGVSATLLSIVPETPPRLRKHLARPSAGSACKRLAMYARWMVRPGPVDLGLWTAAHPRQLVVPLDVHTGRQARQLGMLTRRQDDWRAVQELTAACRALCPDDPARYDFALFGLGAYEGRELQD